MCEDPFLAGDGTKFYVKPNPAEGVFCHRGAIAANGSAVAPVPAGFVGTIWDGTMLVGRSKDLSEQLSATSVDASALGDEAWEQKAFTRGSGTISFSHNFIVTADSYRVLDGAFYSHDSLQVLVLHGAPIAVGAKNEVSLYKVAVSGWNRNSTVGDIVRVTFTLDTQAKPFKLYDVEAFPTT